MSGSANILHWNKKNGFKECDELPASSLSNSHQLRVGTHTFPAYSSSTSSFSSFSKTTTVQKSREIKTRIQHNAATRAAPSRMADDTESPNTEKSRPNTKRKTLPIGRTTAASNSRKSSNRKMFFFGGIGTENKELIASL